MVETRVPTLEEVRRRKAFEALQARLGYNFGNDTSLLRQAVEHSSSANEREGQISNERLEFLGDAVLYLAISQRLFSVRPPMKEGELTNRRKSLIMNKTLVRVGDQIGLREPGLIQVGGSVKMVTDKMVADTMEAIIGAIYIKEHGSMQKVLQVVEELFAPIIDELLLERDWVSELKVWCDRNGLPFPKDPPNEKRKDGLFHCHMQVGGHEGYAKGASKPEAKMMAARSIVLDIEKEADRRPNV